MAMKNLVVLAIGCFTTGLACLAQENSAPRDNILQQAQKLVDARELGKAGELLGKLLRQNPKDEAANLKLGEIRLAQGLNEDALKSFEIVLTLQPDSPPAREGEVKAAEAAALTDRKAGIDGSALLCLMRARKFVPDSPQLLLDFGIQADSMRIYGDADAALTRAHTLAPDDPKILYALAHVQLDEQKMPEAEMNLRAYLQAKPYDATAHYGLGRLLHMLMRDEEAKTELERSITLQPRQSSSFYELGEIARETDNPEEAKRNYEKVLALAPHHGGALTGLGIVAYRAKDYASADKYLQSAVTYAADYATAHHYYALVLIRLGREVESKREADLAESLNRKEARERGGNQLTVLE
jgi:tetratricopeptide (TPR) repeat protein